MSNSSPDPSPKEQPLSLVQELKQRHVFRLGGGYAFVGWLVIQFAVATFPSFDFPSWVTRAVILAVLGGFPLAIASARAFELTARGIRRTRSPDRRTETPEKANPWKEVFLIALGTAEGFRIASKELERGRRVGITEGEYCL